MAKGFSLHIGVNHVDPAHYGYPFPLKWSKEDALGMQKLAKENNYDETHYLLDEQATTKNFFRLIEEAKEKLEPDGIFMLTFSGHGAQCPDYNLDEAPGDDYDEAWVLYDRMLLDDEGVHCWLDFDIRTRILIVTDCCYSGSFYDTLRPRQPVVIPDKEGLRSLSPFHAREIMEKNPDAYRAARNIQTHIRNEITAPSIQLSACRVNEGAMEYRLYKHGAFTHALLEAWKEGGFNEYRDFYNRIVDKMPLAGQTPGLQSWGANCAAFMKQRPFKI